MFTIEFYDENKTYYKNEGGEYTKEEMITKFPKINTRNTVLVCENYSVPVKTMNIDHAQQEFGGDYNIDKEIMVASINSAILNSSTESSPLERIAAALEYLVMVTAHKEE